MFMKQSLRIAAVVAAIILPGLASAQETIKVGNTMPYSGPGSAYSEIGKVMKAYFDKVNAEGGINGRKIEFLSYDDGYSPPRTVEQARRLIERDNVLLLAGTFGTPHNLAIHRYVNMRKVPHLFVGSTGNAWNDPKNFPWTVCWQPNAHIEGTVYGTFLAKYHPAEKIAILMQNDEYGRSFITGIEEGLGDKVSNIVSRATYEATDPTIDNQVTNLYKTGAGVLIDLSTPKFTAQAIRKVADLNWHPVHIVPTAAASASQVMQPAGIENSQGIITAAYLKDPTDPRWKDEKGMSDFRAFMEKYAPQANAKSVFSVIGYSWGQATTYVLQQAGNELTRDNIMKVATNLHHVELPLLLPGLVLDNNPDDVAPIKSLQLTRFEGETWAAFDPDKK
ncbi:ABC transporter substrate-binding protein [Agrobacterium tumefaciens]|uniref:ABC transporter substrate-binding protein n=1 Tax=Agrobacterium tumefaciens TaxID=358 RepID=UPI001F2E4AF9|nr:ABC transporter substrate-binding protein [Agrobacterium tumefaciens]